MGKNIFNCGRIGAGQIVKICNNMALAVQMIAVA
jgi:3-hydroxyisobutyrate dehydrogenase